MTMFARCPKGAVEKIWPMVGVGLALAVLLATGLLQSKVIRTLVENEDWVVHTHQVLAELDGVHSGLQQAELGTRGYVATGVQDYLEMFQQGLEGADKHFRDVRGLTADNPSQQQNLDHLTELAITERKVMERLITLRRDQGPAAAREEPGGGEWLTLMTKIRAVTDDMEGRENALLRHREVTTRAATSRASLVIPFSTILALSLTFAACCIAYRNAIKQRQSEEEPVRKASFYGRSLLEASLDPLVTINRDGKITDVNQATELVTGAARQQLIGSDFSTYFTEPEEARKGYEQVFAQNSVRDYPLAIRHTSGRITEVLYNATLFKDEAGQIEGVFAAARDVTERKRAEEQLRKRSLYSRSLLEASLDPLVTINRDGKITDVNQATELVTGAARQQLIGSDFSTYFTEPEEARKGYEQVFAQNSVRDYPLAIRHTSGRITEVLYNATLFKDEAGQIEGVFAAARDVTERKRAEEQLRKRSLYSRSLLEASLDPLVTISRDGKITDVNQATELVTGAARQQLIGSDFSTYFTEPEKARKGYEQVFAQNSVRDYPLAIRHTSGRITEVLYNATLFKDEAGQIEGVFAAARDITERKKLDDERATLARRTQHLNEELEQEVKARTAALLASNKELEAFAYSVSHDLRAPLRHIDGFLTLLKKKAYAQLDPSAQHYIENVTDASCRLGRLIDELLQYSRLGRSEIHKQRMDLNEVVKKVREELEQESRNRVVRWQVDDLPMVVADRMMLHQILENLLSNALKFTRTRAEAKIVVSSRRDPDGDMVISVGDNGVGFDTQYSGKLFQVFQRLHSEEEFEGTGIGLANIRRMVERHGGRVWAEGELDRGATFYFSLPVGGSNTGETNELTEAHSAR